MNNKMQKTPHNQYNHPYHLVTPSPWPLILSISIMNMLIGVIMWMHEHNMILMISSMMCVIMVIFQWWRDVIRESTFQGMHTKKVTKGLKLGMILFIISEVFFFMSFFWAYLHSMLSPSIEIGMNWPPKGIKMFNPYSIPLLNTIILITSGMSITWSHHSLIKDKKTESLLSLLITILLGMFFSLIQMYEYINAPFTISDGIYGSTFYMATGFHGIHVIIGTTFLLVCLIRMYKMHFSKTHHFGFEAAAWYWHFVDVVWLFLYILMYWWTY